MRVGLLDTLDNEDKLKIPGWRDILNEIYRTDREDPRSKSRQDYVDAHATTARRVGSADYHYHNLSQVYVPDASERNSLSTIWAEIEAESVIFSLYSVLDSLMQEVNLAYGFGIDRNNVYMHHGPSHRRRPQSNCVRCELTSEHDALSEYLDSQCSLDWFIRFRKLRNRLTHRQLMATNTNIVIGESTEYIEIPSDPKAVRYVEKPRQGIEINGYCVDRRRDVLGILSKTYEVILPKIKDI